MVCCLQFAVQMSVFVEKSYPSIQIVVRVVVTIHDVRSLLRSCLSPVRYNIAQDLTVLVMF